MFAGIAAHGVSAQDKYIVKVRDGLAFSEFKRSADSNESGYAVFDYDAKSDTFTHHG